MDIAALDEKFQISTVLEVDADGKPVNAKMSKLTIMGKSVGQLGEAELDMSRFSLEESNVMRLSLSKCSDPDAFIEVGLKATEEAHDPKGRASMTPRSQA
jgi:hypothetical protein